MGRADKMQAAIDHLVSVVMELREAEVGDDTGLCLGDLIARHREAWGYSLQALADRIGASKAHVWEMEQGRTVNPTAALIGRLSEALVIPPIHILNAALLSQRLQRTALETPND